MPNTNELMELLEKLGAFLSTYGAWGVAALVIVLFIAYFLFNAYKTEKYITTINDRYDQNIKTLSEKYDLTIKNLTDLLEKRNSQLVGLIQKCSGAIANSTTALEETHDLLRQNKVLLEGSKREKEDVEALLEKTNRLIDVFIRSNK